MSWIDIITPIVGAATTALTTVFAYRRGRRKSNADAQKSEMENIEGAISIWRNLAEDMAKKAEEISKRSAEDYQILYKQNVELLSQNKTLISKINKLERELEIFKKST